MDATWMIPAFVVIDPWMERLGHRIPRPPLKGGDSQGDGQPFPFHRTHGPIRRYHDHDFAAKTHR